MRRHWPLRYRLQLHPGKSADNATEDRAATCLLSSIGPATLGFARKLLGDKRNVPRRGYTWEPNTDQLQTQLSGTGEASCCFGLHDLASDRRSRRDGRDTSEGNVACCCRMEGVTGLGGLGVYLIAEPNGKLPCQRCVPDAARAKGVCLCSSTVVFRACRRDPAFVGKAFPLVSSCTLQIPHRWKRA